MYVLNVLDHYSELLELFKERKFIKYDAIVPTYACSIGCHIFNLVNKYKPIYTEGDIVPDTRLHLFMVTIPGFGKTYLINQMMAKKGGILSDCELKVAKIGSLTSGGLVGSIKSSPNNEKIINRGLLEVKHNYILGSDEFSNVIMSSKTSHSNNLINDLLTALDDGVMNKGQVAGGLEYETHSTIWAATQPGRFELKSGLARRFGFVVYMPTFEDAQKFRLIRQETKDLKLNANKVIEFRLELNEKIHDIKNKLKRINFTKEYYDWIRSKYATHYEDQIYEKFMIGYWIMKSDSIGEKLDLTLNDEIKYIIDLQIKSRLKVQEGIEKIHVIDILKNIDKIKYDELYKILLNFTLTPKLIDTKLTILKNMGVIKIENGYVIKLKEGRKN